MLIWICEDNYDKYSDLAQECELYEVAVKRFTTLGQLLDELDSTIPDDSDVFVVDSDMPVRAKERQDMPKGTRAGEYICALLRSRGWPGGIIWNSVVRSSKYADLPGPGVERRLSESEIVATIREWESRAVNNVEQSVIDDALEELNRIVSSATDFHPLIPLMILCEGYLAIAGFASGHSTGNPVFDAIQGAQNVELEDVRKKLVNSEPAIQRWIASDNQDGWFDVAIESFQQVKSFSDGRLPKKLSVTSGRAARVLEGVIQSDRTGTVAAIREIDDNDSIGAVAENLVVGLFHKLIEITESKEPVSVAQGFEIVRNGYLGLRLLAMVHL